MTNKIFRLSALFLSIVLVTFGLTVSLQSLLAAWTPPQSTPPGGNASKPIYASSSSSQLMDNGLASYGNLSANKLFGLEICFPGNDCKTAWDTAGDNLGNHAATTNLDMASHDILNASALSIGTNAVDDLLTINGADVNNLILPVRLRNPNATDSGGSAVGMGFKVAASNGDNYYKSGIAFERKAAWGLGSLHFLVDSTNDNSNADLSDAVMSLTKAGSVGIGITDPGNSSKLYVLNDYSSNANNFGIQSRVSNDATLTAARTLRAGYFEASNKQVENGFNSIGYGVDGYSHADEANTFYWLRGGNFTARSNSTSATNQDNVAGTLSTGQLSSSGTLTNAFGSYNQASNESSGTIGTARGAYNVAFKSQGSTGIITNAYGTYSSVNNANTTGEGEITTAYSYYGNVYKNAAAADYATAYGLRLNVNAGATRWGVFTENEHKNYFSGNIGIGTQVPGDKLHISGGDIRLDNNRGITFLKNDGTDDSTRIFRASGNALRINGAANDIIVRGLDASATAVSFRNSADATVGRIALNSGNTYFNSGNVGIGTAGPAHKLDVSGNINGSGLCINGSCKYAWDMAGDNLGNHTATTNLNLNNNEVDNIHYLNIRSAEGYGLRFWSNDSYAINMGNSAEYRYGPVTDYSIKMNMNNQSNRGWTWGVDGVVPIAALNTQGNLQLAGETRSSWVHATAAGDNTFAGNVGIGTLTPGAKLEVADYGSQTVSGGDVFAANIHSYHNNGLLVHTGFNDGVDIARFSSIGSGYIEVPRMVIRDDGNVGIGTTNPGQKLHVAGTGSTRILVDSNDAAGNMMLEMKQGSTNKAQMFYQNSNNTLNLVTLAAGAKIQMAAGSGGSANQFVIDGTGRVGIGTTTPAYKLDITGSARVTGSVTALAFYYSSDGTLKENIRPIEHPLKKILELEGVEFKWKDSEVEDIGLIAQDVEKVFPELVGTDPATGLKSVKYGNLVAPLIEAIKEQQAQIESLREEINELRYEK